ncbi:MAG: SRPBCC family protein [Solirubrobacteraceae bacterium]
MRRYHFVTTWCLGATVEDVYDTIHDSGSWPQWWPAVRRAELVEDGDAAGVGRLWRFTWRGALPYDLVFESRVTSAQRPWLLEGAADGELVGTGRWRLFDGPAGTAVVYEWDVATSRAWMNRIAPLARPAFAWNHNAIMRQGGAALARRLGVPLLAQS